MLRLYVHVSWYTQRPIPEAEGDYEWMLNALKTSGEQARIENCRMTMHSAQAVNFAYGEKAKSWERWLELKRYSDEWKFSKPKYLNPIYAMHHTDGEPFPKRIYANPLYGKNVRCQARAQSKLTSLDSIHSPKLCSVSDTAAQ